MNNELLLQGLFRRLVRAGWRLSVRDYQDALRALEQGYGLHRREELLWLCRTLWARSEDEVRQLDLLFQSLPLPSVEEMAAITGAAGPSVEGNRPEGGQYDESRSTRDGDLDIDDFTAANLRFQFVPPSQPGQNLPRAQITAIDKEQFVLTPQPLIALRSMIIAWRRYRALQRSGPKIELDVEATIDARCRTGLITTPVLVPRRRNQARLIVLVDISPSMIVWNDFSAILVSSLRESQLSQYFVYYFDNVPEEQLYLEPAMHAPTAIGRLLAAIGFSPLLIVSDAGAARRTCNVERITATRTFLASVAGYWRPTVWLNPVPAARWARTSAERIARLPQVSMFELDEDGLIDAIDVLRGHHTGS